MFNIKDFFSRIQGVQAREVQIRVAVRESIKKHVGLEVPIERISFAEGTVILKGLSQTARSVIFIKKEPILSDINNTQSLRKVTDLH